LEALSRAVQKAAAAVLEPLDEPVR
jgi:hypothetical protein